MQTAPNRTSSFWKKLFASPEMYLWQFDGNDALFINMRRSDFAASVFTDQRIQAANDEIVRVPIAELLEAQTRYGKTTAGPTGVIFHMAYTGSTLLARALDVESRNLVYREPLSLRQLAVGLSSDQWPGDKPEDPRALLSTTLALLSRRFQKSGPVIIKANVPVNFMLEAMLEDTHGPDSALFLYAELEDYLVAVLKSDNHIEWVRRILQEMGPGIDRTLGTSEAQRGSLSDAEAAACIWLAQIRLFEQHCDGENRACLDFETWLAKPKSSLARSFRLFQQPVKKPQIEAITTGELFTRHAKTNASDFSNADRLAAKSQLREQLAESIVAAKRWLEDRGESAHCNALSERAL